MEPMSIHSIMQVTHRSHESLNLPNPKGMMSMLLEQGADPNIKNSQGHTPLHFLVLLSSDVDIARMLIDAGAEIDPRDNAGNTPLLLVLENIDKDDLNESHKAVAQLLLVKEADIYAKNHKGITPVISSLKTNSSEWFF